MKKTTQDLLKFSSVGIAAISLAACGGDTADAPAETSADTAAPPAASAPAATPEENAVVFEPEFPKAMFQGTPTEAKLPNLEKKGEPVLSLEVAEGTELISEGATVTASDDLPTIGDLEQLTDGEKEGGDGYYVEFGPGKQWAQLDLGEAKQIEGITMWHWHKNERAYVDVIVQISDDPTFTEGVTTVFNNDHDNSSELGKGDDPAYLESNLGRVIDVNGVNGQHVRFYSNGNTSDSLNHYVEVEVYGK